MKKFRCVVTREDIYEVEIDENEITEEWLKNFRGTMYDFRDYESHAEHIAQLRARFGEEFMEGYGYISVNSEKPFAVICDTSQEENWCKGININVISEDDEIEVSVKEVKQIEVLEGQCSIFE